MRRLLFIISCFAIAIAGKAQAPSFSTPNAAGVLLHYNIIDAANRYVEFTNSSGGSSWWLTDYTATTISVPATVVNPNNGQTYTVKRIGDYALYNSAVKHFDMPTTVEEIGNESFRYVNLQDQLVFHEGLRNVGAGNFNGGNYGSGTNLTLTLPSTCDSIGWMNFAHAYNTGTVDLSKCTKLKYLVGLNFHRGNIHTLLLPEGLVFINGGTFDDNKLVSLDIPSTVRRINNNAFGDNPTLKTVNLRKVPVVIDCEDGGFGSGAPFGNAHADLKIYVNTDHAGLYTAASGWSDNAGHYVETVDVGTSGYTSYYLENENFKVPAGCTAYIITGITPSGSIMTPDQAQVTAFTAGKIIPKQTGFILQGTPSSTIEYYAAVTGTEESVTNNLLIGTATEQEFNASGYKYYIFSNNGDEGLGFYKQGTRNGASIKLAAHRAGLRLPLAIAPAKGFTIDFDAARKESETTGIHTVKPTTPAKEDVVYDLQGRRVTNPGRGIYIVNGKKIIK